MRYFVRRGNDGRAWYLFRVDPTAHRVEFYDPGHGWIERRGPYSEDDFRLRMTATDYYHKALYDPGTDYDEIDEEEAGAVMKELDAA